MCSELSGLVNGMVRQRLLNHHIAHVTGNVVMLLRATDKKASLDMRP